MNKDLGFSPSDRKENIRRIGEVSALFAKAGVVCIAAFISPYKEDREAVRKMYDENFHEVFIKANISTCENRDPKSLYKKARAGLINNFTGVSAPYEAPDQPDLIVNTSVKSIDECLTELVRYIKQHVKALPPSISKKVTIPFHRNKEI